MLSTIYIVLGMWPQYSIFHSKHTTMLTSLML